MTEAPAGPLKRTPLYELHRELGARLVPFAGYEMPVQYPTGILVEHAQTRNACGLFDVSHMGQLVVRGAGVGAALERLVAHLSANDLADRVVLKVVLTERRSGAVARAWWRWPIVFSGATGADGAGATGRVMKPMWEFRQRGQSGRWVSELFPHMARHADDYCVVRSMHTEGVAHGPATLFLHTGTTNQIRPSMGSWVTYGLGSESRNHPGFVVLQSGPRGPRGGVAGSEQCLA